MHDDDDNDDSQTVADMTRYLRPLITSVAYLLVEHGEFNPTGAVDRAAFVFRGQEDQGMTNLVALGSSLIWAKDCLDTLAKRADPDSDADELIASGIVTFAAPHDEDACHDECRQAIEIVKMMSDRDDDGVSLAIATLAATDDIQGVAIALLQMAIGFRRGDDETEILAIKVPDDVSDLTRGGE